MTKLLSQQLLEHIRVVHEGKQGWEQSRNAILSKGSEAALLLIEVLKTEIQKSQESIVVISYKKMIRLADVLAEIGDPRGLEVLTHVAGLSNSDRAMHQLLRYIQNRASSADRTALLSTLKEFPNNIAVAETLVQIAERDPHLELRAALPTPQSGPCQSLGASGVHRSPQASQGGIGSSSAPHPRCCFADIGGFANSFGERAVMRESELQAIEAILDSPMPVVWNQELVAYEESVAQLCAHASLESIPLLLRITQEGSVRRRRVQVSQYQRAQKRYQEADYTYGYLDRAALTAARALVQLAEKEPTRELLPALEALRSGLANANAPLEFIPIRLRLARALKHLNNLPIPAAAPELPRENLPLPAKALDD